MTLLSARKQFVNQSGRLDLMNEDGSDNGADFYINAGQKYLDRMIESREDIARSFRYISAGDYFMKFVRGHCRSIHQVGIGTTESFEWLNRENLIDLRSKFNKPFEYIEKGKPQYFAPAYLRPAQPELDDTDGIVGYMDVMEGWRYYNGIILLPPADQSYHIEVWGKFHTTELVNDDDESFWTKNFEYILVMAAQRSLEVFYRNSQGVKDWTASIQSELFEMEKDFIEETYFGFDQMKG